MRETPTTRVRILNAHTARRHQALACNRRQPLTGGGWFNPFLAIYFKHSVSDSTLYLTSNNRWVLHTHQTPESFTHITEARALRWLRLNKYATPTTTADRVALALGHDGQRRTTRMGDSLEDMCERMGGKESHSVVGVTEWRFPDGSVIVAGRDSWDVDASWEAGV